MILACLLGSAGSPDVLLVALCVREKDLATLLDWADAPPEFSRLAWERTQMIDSGCGSPKDMKQTLSSKNNGDLISYVCSWSAEAYLKLPCVSVCVSGVAVILCDPGRL